MRQNRQKKKIKTDIKEKERKLDICAISTRKYFELKYSDAYTLI